MSTARAVLEDAIAQQKRDLEIVEEETREARRAGDLARQRWETEKRKLAELEQGLVAVKNAEGMGEEG